MAWPVRSRWLIHRNKFHGNQTFQGVAASVSTPLLFGKTAGQKKPIRSPNKPRSGGLDQSSTRNLLSPSSPIRSIRAIRGPHHFVRFVAQLPHIPLATSRINDFNRNCSPSVLLTIASIISESVGTSSRPNANRSK